MTWKLAMLASSVCVALTAGCVRYTPKPLSLTETMASFESRSLTNAELQSFIQGHLSNQAVPIDEWNFDALTLATFWYHPGLQVARAQYFSAAAAKETAAGRPNPTVGFSPGYNFNAVSPVSPWIPGMTVDLPIETAGKRSRRMLQARLNAEAGRLSVVATGWQARSNLRSALLEVVAASRKESLLAGQITNQSLLLGFLKQRFAAGAVAQSEIAPFEINLLRLKGELAGVRSTSIQARSHLAEAIGVPVQAVADLKFAKAAIRDSVEFSPDTLRELEMNALRHRADLLALLARYEAAQAALQLEIAKQYPDLRLGSGYQWDQGENKWNLSLSFEVPIFNRNQGPIAEAEARRSEAAALVIEAQIRIANEIDRALALWTSAREEAGEAHATQAALALQSALARQRFAAGAADQLELQTALTEEGAAALFELDAETRVSQAAAQLEFAVQVPLTFLEAAVQNNSQGP
jgi:cobalt-zinc-cadmium efflux system outer membrane protein